MTVESPAPPPPPAAPVSPPPPAAPRATSNALSGFSQAELLIGGGALLTIAGDLVFDLLGPYSGSIVIWTAAAFALLMMALRRMGGAMPSIPYDMALEGAGLVAALAGVRNLAGDLVALASPSSSISIGYGGGTITIALGAGLMGVGAYQMWRHNVVAGGPPHIGDPGMPR